MRPAERFENSSCMARHAFFDTYDLKLSTGFTNSLNTVKFYYIIYLWNIAALRIVLQASNCFDQSEDLRSIIAVVICAWGFESGSCTRSYEAPTMSAEGGIPASSNFGFFSLWLTMLKFCF